MKKLPVNEIVCGDWEDVLKTFPNKSVHCCITSPPYWGQRDYGVKGQLGLEKTPEEHIENLVKGFRKVRRVLRDDGVLFLNYGDKYAGSGGDHKFSKSDSTLNKFRGTRQTQNIDLSQSNLLGLAWRLALAMQADGWILRSDTIWAKAVSFCETYSGSTMPESVNGWWWERHRIKVKPQQYPKEHKRQQSNYVDDAHKIQTQWKPCPGCPKCEPNGGLVLRRGSWRPTRAHEYMFLFTKTNDYFCDQDAVREANSPATLERIKYGHNPRKKGGGTFQESGYAYKEGGAVDYLAKYGQAAYTNPSGRNPRDVWTVANADELSDLFLWWLDQYNQTKDVWTINPQAFADTHYATFPERLIEPCVRVGTSQKGCCPECGSPWARVVNMGDLIADDPIHSQKGNKYKSRGGKAKPCVGYANFHYKKTTLGWRATCDCGIKKTIPCIVLDPFAGSGTTCLVAKKLNRWYVGIEISKKYHRKAEKRLRRIRSSLFEVMPEKTKLKTKRGRKASFGR